MKRLALVTILGAALGLASCASDAVRLGDGSDLPPPDSLAYRKKILDWAKGYFLAPAAIRSARISEPVPAGFGFQRVWLVCIEYDVQGENGAFIGPRRLPFGVNATTFSAPLARGDGRLTIVPTICDDPALAWRPFPELERLRAGRIG